MHPIFFQFGNVKLYTYGLFIAIGFFTGVLLAQKEAKKNGVAPERITDMAFFILIAAVIGARLMYVLPQLDYYAKNPLEIFKLWTGGLVFYGGFLLAVITGMAYLKKMKLPLWFTADIIAPSIALGHGIGRLGCLFAGCCYGKVCDLPWAVTFHNQDSLAPLNIALHPTQIYHSIGNILIFLFLIFFKRYKTFDGQLFWMYVLTYSIVRSFVEIFRGDDRGGFFFTYFSMAQVTGFFTAVIAVAMLFILSRNRFKTHAGN